MGLMLELLKVRPELILPKCIKFYVQALDYKILDQTYLTG